LVPSRPHEPTGMPRAQRQEVRMRKIEAIIQPYKLDDVQAALLALGVQGMTVSEVRGFGHQRGGRASYRGAEFAIELLPKLKLEIVVATNDAERIVAAIASSASTGQIGDGKIFVLPVDDAVRIRTGERRGAAIGSDEADDDVAGHYDEPSLPRFSIGR
jgi:nitrogen regulatory protein P-II 1